MKSLFICVVAVILGVSYVTCDIREFYAPCREQTQANVDEVEKYFKVGMKDEDVKDNLKCYMKCLIEKQGHFKNGAYDAESARKYLKSLPSLKDRQDDVDKAIDECKNKKGATDCDTAFMIFKCMIEKGMQSIEFMKN